MAEVQLREIEKRFGSQRILSGLNLVVPHGRYLVILGASGCGKTTLLKIVAGLVAADSGVVTINGRDMHGVPPRRRDVAMVFQGDALYPHLTIAQSLAVGLKRRLPADQWESRLNDAIEIAGIQEILARKPDGLSGGELRRAAVAKAIVRRSSVRLLDEPLSALDANVRHSIGQSLLQWHDSNPGTTIHVTHDGQEAMRMGDQIAVVDQGRVVQAASPAEIYNAPENKTVALAIGSPPMNFCDAECQAGKIRFQLNSIQATETLQFPQDLNQKISVGFRAESCQRFVESDASRPGITITGEVTRSEMVDGRSFADIKVQCETVTATAASDVSIGDPIMLFVPKAELHLFDAASGQRIAV